MPLDHNPPKSPPGRPSDIDRMVVDSGVCFFKIAFLMGYGGNFTKGNGSGSKSGSGFYHGPPGEGLGVYRPMR